MLIDFKEFIARLKSLGLPVYRNQAVDDAKYPYWIYTPTTDETLYASGQHIEYLNEYQVSLFTLGVEKELFPFRKEFKDMPYRNFSSLPGDENDDTVTNFYTYVKVIANE